MRSFTTSAVALSILAAALADSGIPQQKYQELVKRTEIEITKAELNAIGDKLTWATLQGHEPGERSAHDMTRFLRKEMQSEVTRDTSRDCWGEPYRVRAYTDRYQISSNGPDRIPYNEDDLTVEIKTPYKDMVR